MLSCERAALLITKETDGAITFGEGLQLKMHVMMCKFCRLFRKQNRFISDSTSHLSQHADKCLPGHRIVEDRKAAMQQALQDELNKDS